MSQMGLIRVLLVALALCAGQAHAAAAPRDASTFVRDLGKEAIRVLSSKGESLAQREAKFQAILYDKFDVRTIGRFALGRYWRQASSEQKNDYLRLFGTYIAQDYSTKVGGYTGETLTIDSETPLKNKIDVLVNTRITRPSGPPIKITWRVRFRANGPRIIDVMVEGISMALTQRQQFSSVVSRYGLQGLLETLRARTTKVRAKP